MLERLGFLKHLFENFFIVKKIKEAQRAKEAEEAQRKRREAETRDAREREKRRKEQEDAGKEYNLRQADQDRIESATALEQIKREEVKNKLDQFVTNQGARGAAYLFDFNELARDDTLVRNLKTLIDQSPGATYCINDLVSGGSELHSDPARLIDISRNLLYEAELHGMRASVAPLLSAIRGRVDEILADTIVEHYRQEGVRISDINTGHYVKWFEENTRFKLTDNQRRDILADNLQAAVDDMFVTPPRREPTDIEDTSYTNVRDRQIPPGELHPPQKVVDEVNKIMLQAKQAEEAGSHLTVGQLTDLYRDLQRAESRAVPIDMAPDSKTYNREVAVVHRYVNERLDAVARKLTARMKTEKAKVAQGITDPKAFLREMELKPGHLGYVLEASPKMRALLTGHVAPEDIEKSVQFRNQVFLTIHKKILNDKHSSSGENFGLYERADLSTFLDILSSEMSDLIRPETRESYGQTWVNWYVQLSSSLRLSRDIDFYASQPGVDVDDWAKSFSLMKNELTTQGMALPAVEQAYRALETTLRSIRDTYDGYIPPKMIEYDSAIGATRWDYLSMGMLENMSKSGVVYDVARDTVGGFHVAEADGKRIKLGKKINFQMLREGDNPAFPGRGEDPESLEMKMYMTLGKGFGLASLRFLEIFANSRVPGSRQPDSAMDYFHSIPYEGPARALNYVNTVLHKWKFGTDKYMEIMNTMLSSGHKIPHMNAKHAKEAWGAYLDGTFEEKYGHEAKRMLDKFNFSGMSSGFGSNYSWRQIDSTIGWSDKQRELMGGPMKILISGRLATELVKDHMVVNRYRQEFREQLQRQGQPTAGSHFDALWQERGLPMYKAKIEKEWEHMDGKKKKDLIKAYQRAIVSRSWVETAMRNPLAVAHALDVKVKDDITGKERKVRLHNLIIHKVLGISPEDTKFENLESLAAAYASPSAEQLRYTSEILGLEQDIAAVRELALNGDTTRGDNGNRDLTEEDFNIIGDETRRRQAIKYWKLTQQALFGHQNPEHLYDEIGLKLMENGHDYEWRKNKIGGIGHLLEHIGEERIEDLGIHALLTERLVDKEWDVTIGTDSTSFRQMDLLNLGSRQWVRLAGDAAAHFHGGDRLGKFFVQDLVPDAQPENLAKAQLEIRQMYEGDAIEAGWKVNSFLANMVNRLYGFDYPRLGSPAQLNVWKTRRHVAGWHANNRRKYIDALEHLGVLPAEADAWGYNIPEGTDIHHLKITGRATNEDVWIEIFTLGVAMAVVLTLWRSLTSKDEEEGGGGAEH